MTPSTGTPAPAAACLFCEIAAGSRPATLVYEDEDIVAFLDIAPIRPGHTQIVPRAHFATFEVLPPALAAKILALGQQLASRMKAVYQVDRVAFLFTGGDVAHAHAHVVPMREQTDVTSARYIASPGSVSWSSAHLRVEPAELLRVRDELGFHRSSSTIPEST